VQRRADYHRWKIGHFIFAVHDLISRSALVLLGSERYLEPVASVFLLRYDTLPFIFGRTRLRDAWMRLD
jgi:hypothetical protein